MGLSRKLKTAMPTPLRVASKLATIAAPRLKGGVLLFDISAKPASMKRHFFLVSGWASLCLGAIGAFLPLLPTVPFVILAAFCFARSSPRLEAWLVTHPQFGHHIVAWREKGAISRKGKVAASVAFAVSIVLAAIFSPWPWVMAPVIAAVVTGSWIWTRPEA